MTRNDISSSPAIMAALLLVLVSAAAITPLRVVLSAGQASMAWDGFALLYGFVFLVALALLSFVVRRNKLKGLVEPAVLLVLLIGVYLTAEIHAGLAGYARLLAVILVIPLLRFARGKAGRAIMLLLLIASLSLQSVWAVGQFAVQSDYGLAYIGEADFRAEAGIARFATSNGAKLVRAYGGFPHPNSLGGSLALALTALLFLVATRDCRRTSPGCSHRSVLMIVAYMLSLGVVVSFSRVAIVAAAVAWAVFILGNRSTRTKAAWRPVLVAIVLTLIVFTPLFSARQSDEEDAGVSGRLIGLEVHRDLLTQRGGYPLFGLGVDAYPAAVARLPSGAARDYEHWDTEAIHSVPLLVLWEVGIVATVLVSLGLLRWLSMIPRKSWVWLLPVIPLAVFDHYLFTQFAPLFILTWFALMLESR